MKHRVAGRKLGRTSAHRLALLRNLSRDLFDKERIRTTLTRAKELRPFAERLLTLSKRETLHARRQVLRHIHDRKVVGKLFDTLSARFAQRPGGYTRILRLGPRLGDHAEMAIIELVEAEPAAKEAEPEAKGKPARRKKAPAAAPKKEAAQEGAKEEAPARRARKWVPGRRKKAESAGEETEKKEKEPRKARETSRGRKRRAKPEA